jgi:hypothetical protein
LDVVDIRASGWRSQNGHGRNTIVGTQIDPVLEKFNEQVLDYLDVTLRAETDTCYSSYLAQSQSPAGPEVCEDPMACYQSFIQVKLPAPLK